MKFEIDVKTGLIQHETFVQFGPNGYVMNTLGGGKKSFIKLEKQYDINSTIESSRQTEDDFVSSEELEQILYAVKKTQTKLQDKPV